MTNQSETQTKTYNPRVERIEKVWTPEAKLLVPYNASEIAFASPAFGSNTYIKVGKDILSKNLKVPIGDYTASLLHPAYCNSEIKDEPEFKKVRDITESNWLWIYNRNLWDGNGVYVFQDLEAIGRSQPLDINELERMLKGGKEINGIRFSGDGRVRFAPKETYRLGEHTPESFAKDGVIIASCGQEGAEKLGEVSAEFESNPYIYGVKVQEGQAPEQRVSAVDGGDDRLRFSGDDFGGSGRGHAFGVLK